MGPLRMHGDTVMSFPTIAWSQTVDYRWITWTGDRFFAAFATCATLKRLLTLSLSGLVFLVSLSAPLFTPVKTRAIYGLTWRARVRALFSITFRAMNAIAFFHLTLRASEKCHCCYIRGSIYSIPRVDVTQTALRSHGGWFRIPHKCICVLQRRNSIYRLS